jgi:NAD(P)-dependent dehydrogenase (short-subunit alcohol dehydrogenase family)
MPCGHRSRRWKSTTAKSYLDSLFSLAGKFALVTGGATGIGRMTAEALMHAGATVVIASRKLDACEEAASSLNALGTSGTAKALAADISNEAGVAGLSDEMARRYPHLSILINNAGISWGAPLDDFPYSAWNRVMSVNVAGMFTLTQKLLPVLSANASPDDPARVINLGSVMGAQPMGDRVYSYSASKAAVHHLTRILAKELAPRHITVNALSPGLFESRMTAFATKDAERLSRIRERIPLRRLGRPEDIASAMLLLCGSGGSYVTGAIIPVDGGVGVETGPDLWGTHE